MSLEILSFNVVRMCGTVETVRVWAGERELKLGDRHLVGISPGIARLTRLTKLSLHRNPFGGIPAGVLAMTQLTELNVVSTGLVALPREIANLVSLKTLVLNFNRLTAVPRELGRMRALENLQIGINALTSLPSELGQLALCELFLVHNQLTWLPLALDRLPAATEIFLNENPLPVFVGFRDYVDDSRDKLPEIFAATTTLLMIREAATELSIALQDLFIPALVTLEIIDAAFRNSIPMHKKWELVTAVKHFHERRGIER